MNNFDWNPTKNLSNQSKHDVRFEDAALVFDDPFCVTTLNSYEQSEERWTTIGMGLGQVLILVVQTYRDDNGTEIIRIISARRASKQERRDYEREYR